jgi:hypothetical protein
VTLNNEVKGKLYIYIYITNPVANSQKAKHLSVKKTKQSLLEKSQFVLGVTSNTQTFPVSKM